jgi:hypothetical protein
MAAAIAAGWSSGAWWPACPHATVSSAAMLSAHHAAISLVIRSVGDPSKVISSLGTSALAASQASNASIRSTSSAGSPSIGIWRAHARSGLRVSRVGYGARYACRSPAGTGVRTPFVNAWRTRPSVSRPSSSPPLASRIVSARLRAWGDRSPEFSGLTMLSANAMPATRAG